MKFSFEIDGDVQVSRRLLRFGSNARDARPVFHTIADDIFGYNRRQFDSQGGYGSGGWKPLKPETVRRKAMHKPPLDPRILRATGKLHRSLTVRGGGDQNLIIDANMFVLGSNLPYSQAHQHGNPANNLPMRKPVELTIQNRKDIIKRIQRWIVRGSIK